MYVTCGIEISGFDFYDKDLEDESKEFIQTHLTDKKGNNITVWLHRSIVEKLKKE